MKLGEEVPAGLEFADQHLEFDQGLHRGYFAGRQSRSEFLDEVADALVGGDAIVDGHVAVGVLRDGALADAEHLCDLALREAALPKITGQQRSDGGQELVHDDFFDELHSLGRVRAGDGISCWSVR